jgi:hypothetical protein
MLHTEIVANNTIETSSSIIKVIIRKNDKNSVLALLALDKNGISPEQLEGLHCLIREGDDGIVIIGSIRHTIRVNFTYPSHQRHFLHQSIWLLLFLQDSSSSLINLSSLTSISSKRIKECLHHASRHQMDH